MQKSRHLFRKPTDTIIQVNMTEKAFPFQNHWKLLKRFRNPFHQIFIQKFFPKKNQDQDRQNKP